MTTDLEWLNLNANRSYPLAEDTQRTSINGLMTIYDNLITDLIVVAPDSFAFPLRLGHVSFTGVLLSIVIVDSNRKGIVSTTVNLADFEYGATYPMTGARSSMSGHIAFGEGVNADIPVGNHQFDIPLAASAQLPVVLGPVTSLGHVKYEDVLTGDIKIAAGNNIGLRYNFSTNSIIVSLLDPTSAQIPKCEEGCDSNGCRQQPILTINDEPPTEFGDFYLREGSGLTITNEPADCKIVLGTEIEPIDLCNNKSKAPKGRPGPAGAKGGVGPPGKCVCPLPPDVPSCDVVLDQNDNIVKP